MTKQSDFDFSCRPLIPYAHNYTHGDYESWHTHRCAQLIHTLSGVIRVETQQGFWVVPPSRGVWIPADIPHALHIVGEVKARVLFVEPLARADLPVICQVVGITPLLRELIIDVLTLPANYEPGSRTERIYELILDEIRLMNTLPFCLPEPISERLKLLCHAVRQAPYEVWTVAKAAEQVNVSVRTLSRHFYQQTGMQFSEWVRRARLLIALTRLAQGEQVTRVALDLGYANPGAFSAMFRRVMGVTPGNYFTP
ncbi:helix-turn-helix transcriptional regulator [Pectobacterium polaris]|uniref:AraC family transcriptional regulator n=1 Tax=Pectobacterium polaris TaxID=2042057 RepID=UPI000EA072D6|nr:helix-turn-helix transcriptional regulator [Pectobacterium polaris]MDE8753882.1 helix-turn-helix transcriptional regulator [Pectobacterium polaris]RJL20042.1 AraC family transcriptional regulator [Pectobacterium polaris]